MRLGIGCPFAQDEREIALIEIVGFGLDTSLIGLVDNDPVLVHIGLGNVEVARFVPHPTSNIIPAKRNPLRV